MAYKVIKAFTDLQDDKYVYTVGADYPREGKKATKKRIAELASDENALGYALIADEIAEDVEDPAEDVEAEEKAE